MDTKAMVWLIAGLIATVQLAVQGYVDPIKEVKRGLHERVEYIKAVITPTHLPGEACHEGTKTTDKIRAYAKSMGCSQDFAGHLIARCLGGVGDETYNIIPQEPKANLQWYHTVEKHVFAYVKGGKTITFEITPLYDGTIKTRPSSLKYKVSDGHSELMSDSFANPEPVPCTRPTLKPN